MWGGSASPSGAYVAAAILSPEEGSAFTPPPTVQKPGHQI